MSRLIDADALIENLQGSKVTTDSKDMDYKSMWQLLCTLVVETIEKEPTVLPSAEPSGDLISRQWLLDLYDIDTTSFKETAKVPLEVIIQNIKDAPSVSIQPKTIANDCDLISREDAIDVVMKHKMPFTIQQEVARKICALPSADRPKVNSAEWVEQKEREFEELNRPKGEWLEVYNFVHLAWECSKCGAITSVKTPFCYECGADMRPEK